jgi:hypothetical protein
MKGEALLEQQNITLGKARQGKEAKGKTKTRRKEKKVMKTCPFFTKKKKKKKRK